MEMGDDVFRHGISLAIPHRAALGGEFRRTIARRTWDA